MSESSILTSQFVRIEQTPASIGERILAWLIDYFLIALYVYTTAYLFNFLRLPSGFEMLTFIGAVYLPVIGYAFLNEALFHGQSIGKKIMNIRVVMADGNTPTIGAYFLRWVLYLIDGPLTGGLGILVILLTQHSQRLGDLAAGTLVIKEKHYKKIQVSLDEYEYLTKDYQPVYPQATDLSLEQIDVITRTLQSEKKNRLQRIAILSKKIQLFLHLTPRSGTDEQFLQTLVRDYQYFALEEI